MATPIVFDNYVRVRATQGMTEFTVIEMVVAVSQTILAMDVLALSSGKVQQAIAAPAASNATVTAGNLPIVGIATAPITTDSNGQEVAGGQTRTTTTVAILDDKLNVLFRWAGGITATAAVTAAQLAFGGTIGLLSEVQDIVIGTKYNLARYTNASSASWYFLSGGTTNGEFIAEELTYDYRTGPVTSEYPTIWCKPILSATVRQFA